MELTPLKTSKAGQGNPPEVTMTLGLRRQETGVKLRLLQTKQKVGAQAAEIANLVVGRFREWKVLASEAWGNPTANG